MPQGYIQGEDREMEGTDEQDLHNYGPPMSKGINPHRNSGSFERNQQESFTQMQLGGNDFHPMGNQNSKHSSRD